MYKGGQSNCDMIFINLESKALLLRECVKLRLINRIGAYILFDTTSCNFLLGAVFRLLKKRKTFLGSIFL